VSPRARVSDMTVTWLSPVPGWSPVDLLSVRDKTVVDVGCGEGAFVRELASLGAHAIGVDPSAEELGRARERPSVADERYVEGGAERLPFSGATAEVITFINSLHHVPESALDAALEEAARVLKPSGTLYVQEPLATGSYFELVRLVDDETRPRQLAHEAIQRAAPRLGAHLEIVLHQCVTHPDVESLRRRLVAVDSQRSDAVDAAADAIARSFETLGARTKDGMSFDLPVRIDLFRLS
jgi:ubiquinone/menaquinone biosynthesis C-methylase UbiE